MMGMALQLTGAPIRSIPEERQVDADQLNKRIYEEVERERGSALA